MLTTIDKCRCFYEEQGAPMIHEKFPEYENRIAVGVCGEGSDCFGFDDLISQDHDFGIGFCMWMTEEDFRKIGTELDREYRKLIGYGPSNRLDCRRGVCTMNDFYMRILEIDIDPMRPGLTMNQWFTVEEHKLACATNGEMFRDDLGYFSRMRKELKYYYPDQIWRMRLVNAIHDFSQYGQANYGRCMARKDGVAAELCRAKGIEAAMTLAFLIRKVYAPYYKWTFRALTELPDCSKLATILIELSLVPDQSQAWKHYDYSPYHMNPDDRIEQLFEQTAIELLNMLYEAEMIADRKVTFLEHYCKYIY